MKQNVEMSSMRGKCRFKGEVFAVKVGDTSICFYVGGNDPAMGKRLRMRKERGDN